MITPSPLRPCLPLLALTLPAALLTAASGTWQGGDAGEWSSAVNWSGGSAPVGATETATFNAPTPVTIGLNAAAAGAQIQQRGAAPVLIAGTQAFSIPATTTAILFGAVDGNPQVSGNLVFEAPVTVLGSAVIGQNEASDVAGRVEFVGPITTVGATTNLTLGGNFDGAIRFSTNSITPNPLRVVAGTNANFTRDRALEINADNLPLDRLTLNRSSAADGFMRVRAVGGPRTWIGSASGAIGVIALGSTNASDLVFDSAEDLLIQKGGAPGNVFNYNNFVPLAGRFTFWQQGSGRVNLDGPLAVTGSAAAAAGIPVIEVRGEGSGEIVLRQIFQGSAAAVSVSVVIDRAVGSVTRFVSSATSYSGGTTVERGTLVVQQPTQVRVTDNAILSPTGTGPVVIRAAGTLAGGGGVGGAVTVDSGGVVAPGEPGGAVAALGTGPLQLAAGSVVRLEVNTAAAASDRIDVRGDLQLAGNLVLGSLAEPATGIAGGTRLALMTYTGSRSGTFAGLAEAAIVTLGTQDFRLRYDDTFNLGTAEEPVMVKAITLEALVEATAYDLWADTSNLPSNQRGPRDDPDQDGQPNVLEFYLRTTPTVANAIPLGASVNGSFLVVAFDRNPVAPGAVTSAFLEYGTPLGTWNRIDLAAGAPEPGSGIQVMVVDVGTGDQVYQTVSLRIPLLLAPAGALFARVVIEP